MEQKSNHTTNQSNSASLSMRVLIGGGIALLLISFFLLTAGEPNPEWPTLWRIKPLIIVPLAGATGGLFFHLVNPKRFTGLLKVLTYTLCLILYIIGLWMGTVLGLNGTYWN
jgi:hypothetical protein